MGLREEIERELRDSEEAFEFYRRVVEIGNTALECKVRVYAGEVSALRTVLAILDEWELVAEHEFTGGNPRIHLAALWDQANLTKSLAFEPGDTIAIYRRRREEEDGD